MAMRRSPFQSGQHTADRPGAAVEGIRQYGQASRSRFAVRRRNRLLYIERKLRDLRPNAYNDMIYERAAGEPDERLFIAPHPCCLAAGDARRFSLSI